jgi:hypothetical protein
MTNVATETRFDTHEVLHIKYFGSYGWLGPSPMLSCRLLIAASMLSLSLPARAARPRDAVLLDYAQSPDAAARCPTSDFLREEVHIRIGHDLFTPDAPQRLTVVVDRVHGGYHVTGELRSKTGDVTLADDFTAEDCSAAIRSLAIMVAVRFTHLPEPCPVCQPPTTAVTTPALAKPAPPPVPPTLPPPPSQRLLLRAGVASTLAIGAAPVVLGGAGWFVGIRWPRFSAAIEGQALFAPSADLRRPRVQDDYHFLFASASASGCVHGAWVFVCLQVGWSSLSLGHATLEIDPDHLSRATFGFRFGGERALTRTLALRAYTEASFGTSYNSLKYLAKTSYTVWHNSILIGSVSIGPVMTF